MLTDLLGYDGDRIADLAANIAERAVSLSSRGELLVPVPVDALIWDADMALYLDAENVRDARGRTILLTGFADGEARKHLTARGFAIVEYAPLN